VTRKPGRVAAHETGGTFSPLAGCGRIKESFR
jgi:hypothetical protein